MYCCIDLMQKNNYITKRKLHVTKAIIYLHSIYYVLYSISMEILL